jgi:hypothetical protein
MANKGHCWEVLVSFRAEEAHAYRSVGPRGGAYRMADAVGLMFCSLYCL